MDLTRLANLGEFIGGVAVPRAKPQFAWRSSSATGSTHCWERTATPTQTSLETPLVRPPGS